MAKSSQAALPLLPPSVKARVTSTLLKSSLPPSWQFLQEVGDNFIAGITPTKEQQDLIEIKTRLQSKCIRWHEERFCRLTASNFGRVLQRKSRFDTLALELLQPKLLQNVPAIQWGHQLELDVLIFTKRISLLVIIIYH